MNNGTKFFIFKAQVYGAIVGQLGKGILIAG